MAAANKKPTTFQWVRDRMQRLVKDLDASKRRSAIKTYKDYGTMLMKTPLSGNQLMHGKERMFPVIRRHHIGRMVMFFYDPKTADKLPYFDRFPLVLPVEMYNDGFLGINLHYLPPMQRAKLLDRVLQVYEDQYMDEKKKLFMTYGQLQTVVRSGLYIPCVKRYLYSHMRSRFYLIAPEDWQISVLLPTERFEKAPKTRVFAESMLKIKKG